MQDIDLEIAGKCKTWPFEEAKAVVNRLRALNKGKVEKPEKGFVVFETGYGPSGLPHIGTFGEVCRTTMVMHAFQRLTDIPAKLICFSDDMDGLRKVPGNISNADVIAPYAEAKNGDEIIRDPSPLSSVPDPYGTHDSFGYHNNDRLRAFLDQFGFDYEFVSSTQDCYISGRFNIGLCKILEGWEEIKETVSEILGEERRKTYAPLFPIIDLTPELIDTYNIESVPRPIILHNANLVGEPKIVIGEDGQSCKAIADFEVTRGPLKGHVLENHSILNGGAKAQWRVDWALRWFALDVDYEMSGKDLKSSADMSGKILQILGGRKPAGFHYELFLDEQGEKISKSKGNGLTMEEWLTYAPHESLAYYMFQRPTSAKKLYFDIIPKAVDEYIMSVEKLPEQEDKQKLENPAWYIHDGRIPNSQHSPISFALLLNLASAANTHEKEILWGFIQQYSPEATPENAPFLDRLVGYAIKYYEDFVLPNKAYRLPDAREQAALEDLAARLEKLENGLEAEDYMTEVFSAGKENGYDKTELRDWFQAIYQILLGQDQGPRFGSFIQLFGPEKTVQMIRDALDGKFAQAA